MGLIHRYWQGPEPGVDYADTLRYCNPGVEIVDWTPDSLPGWIANLAARTARFVVEDRQAQHVANVARIGLLWDQGGWWADHDLRATGPFPTGPAVAAHPGGSLCNCWLAFPTSHHPGLSRAIELISATDGEVRAAVDVSGERLLDRALGPDVERIRLSGWAVHRGWTSRATRSVQRPDRSGH